MANIQENLGAEPNKDDFVLISDEVVRGKINAQLEYITARQFLTPYIGLEAVRKILAYQNLFIPNTVFLDRTSGYDIFDADQFGEKVGMNNDGEVVTAPSSPFKIYFEWKINADGEYDVFCSIVTEDELEELLSDTEEDEDDDEEEEMNEEKKDVPFEGPYSKTVAPKSKKKKHNEVAKLARRAVKEVKKKKLKEDYDHVRKAEAKDAGAIAKRARNPKEKKFWKKAHKDLSKDAVQGRIDEEQLNELRGKSKEVLKAIKARIEKKHDQEWEETYEKRKREKLKGGEKTKKEDKSRNDLAKRWLRADRAEKKLKGNKKK